MKILIFVIILCFFSGCNKADPTPELHDEIYTDLLQELDIASKGLEAEEKNLTKLEGDLDKAVPQTGQIKFAQKKVFETQATINKLRQQKQFFEIKIEMRKAEARERYLEARRGGRKWPDPEEVAHYKELMKLQRDKLEWDKNKGKKKDVPRGTEGGHGAGGTEHGEGGGHEAPPEHH